MKNYLDYRTRTKILGRTTNFRLISFEKYFDSPNKRLYGGFRLIATEKTIMAIMHEKEIRDLIGIDPKLSSWEDVIEDSGKPLLEEIIPQNLIGYLYFTNPEIMSNFIRGYEIQHADLSMFLESTKNRYREHGNSLDFSGFLKLPKIMIVTR